MNDLGTFNDELIRLGPEDGNHMDMTADGIDLLEGNTSVANFTRSGSRMGEADKGHVDTTAQGVTVSDGTQDVARMGIGAVDFHELPVDGVYIPNGQMAATSVYTWATDTGYLVPRSIIQDVNSSFISFVRGSVGFSQDGRFEVTTLPGKAGIFLEDTDDSGLAIYLDNERYGKLRKSGTFRIPWYGSRQVTDVNLVISPSSGITVTAANFIQWGLVVNMQISFKSSSAIANGAQVTIGQVVSDKTPAVLSPGGNASLQGTIATNGMVSVRNVSGAQIAANASNTIGFTYILS